MKRFTLFLFVVLGFTTLSVLSCSKDKDDPEFELAGTRWSGTFDVGAFEYPEFILEFKPNGILKVTITGVNSWDGSWERSSNSNLVNVEWVEDAQTWSGAGELNAANTEITNGFVDRSPQTATATFEVTKD